MLLDQSFTYCLLSMPACQISFDCSLSRVKHFNNKMVCETHVIYCHLNSSDHRLVSSKTCDGKNNKYNYCRLLFLDVLILCLRLF